MSQSLQQFKALFWNFCVERRLFQNVQDDQLPKVQQFIDQSVSNYQSHIIQSNPNNYNEIFERLFNDIEPNVRGLNVMTRESLQSQRSDQFNMSLKAKEKEFNSLIKSSTPEEIDFSIKLDDEPLTSDNLDHLIQQQLKEREAYVHQPPKSNSNSIQIDNDDHNKEHAKQLSKEVTEIKSPPTQTIGIIETIEPTQTSDGFMKKINEVTQSQTNGIVKTGLTEQMKLRNPSPTISSYETNENSVKMNKILSMMDKMNSDLVNINTQLKDIQKIQDVCTNTLNNLVHSHITILRKLK
jgi:hypothetical protein